MIGTAYYLYHATGIVLVSLIVGVIGVALILADKVTRNGKIIGGLMVALSVMTIYTTYNISRQEELSERRGRIKLFGDILTNILA